MILSKFEGLPQLQDQIEMIKEPVCVKPIEKPYRHHIKCAFPGILNWSQEYQDEVAKSHKRPKTKLIFLNAIKEYTLYSKELYGNVLNSDEFGPRKKLLNRFLSTRKILCS